MILTYKTLHCNPPLTPNAFPNALAFPKALTFRNTLACLDCIPSAPAKAGRRLRPTYLINLKTLCCVSSNLIYDSHSHFRVISDK